MAVKVPLVRDSTTNLPIELSASDTISKASVGLGNVDNTSDINKPISTATQTELNNRALIGGTPQFSGVSIGADSDVLLYEGAANQLNLRVGPSTAYKYFSFSANGDFTALNGDVTSKDLRTDRGDGTGAVWFGGAGDGYLYRSGVGSFQLRAGTSFFDLTAPGTILTTGNFDPATKANANAVVDLSTAQSIGGNKTFTYGAIRVQGWGGAADSGVVYIGSLDRYIYKPSGVDHFEFRFADGGAGVAIIDAAGTVWTSGNLNTSTFATSAQGTKADAALPAANLSGFTNFAVVTALPGSPDPNTIYFVK